MEGELSRHRREASAVSHIKLPDNFIRLGLPCNTTGMASISADKEKAGFPPLFTANRSICVSTSVTQSGGQA
jgi:hypothetical protein